MSVLSINTNGAALNALQNLNRTSSDLNETQLRINTGLNVKTAKDNAAVFAIAQNLRADKRGLDAVKNSLDRARSVLDVTTAAAESIQDLLIQIKEKVVAASDAGLDQRSRDALKQDFERLREQISLIASNATFNGTNLIDGPTDATNGKPANLVALVSPDATRQISVPRQDLGLYTLKANATALPTALAADTGGVTEDNATNTVTGNVFTNDTAAAGNIVGTINGQAANVNNAIRTTYGWLRVQSDGSYTYTLDNGRAETQALATPATVNEVFTYQAQRADGTLSAATNLTITVTAAGTGTGEAAPTTPQRPAAQTYPAGTIIKLTPQTTFNDAESAELLIRDIDDSIRNVSQALTVFGAAQKSAEQQRTFIDKLSDTIETGIGNLVDADIARESARLQSLQVKQQLGTQALSIANRQPQSILSLFQG